jgi:hypothetical protein
MPHKIFSYDRTSGRERIKLLKYTMRQYELGGVDTSATKSY